MANAMNLDWENSRAEVVDYVNKYRNLLYTQYDRFKLFDNVFHCICVSTFRERCAKDCHCDTYQGFSLPRDVSAVASAWNFGRPLAIRSRWREAHTGIDTARLPRVEIIEMAEQFPTERDQKCLSRLKVYADSKADCGKTVTLMVTTADWDDRRIEFSLIGDGWAVADVHVRQIRSVALPPDLEGGITLAQEDGYELSRYHPTERVPLYRRFRIATSKCPATVLIQGTKRFLPVWFDTDIVEVGDRMVIDSAARFFRYGDSTTEAAEIRRAQYDKSEMEGYLNGLIARHRGHAVQDGSPFRGRPITRRKSLPGYRR